MHFREYITPEMQEEWFKSINNANNFYYIIEYKSEKIGLVNDKNIDWENKISEGGLFIWENKCLNSIVPMLVSYLMIEIAFYILGWDRTFIKVIKSNKRAIDFNTALGFTIFNEEKELDYLLMRLTREQFEEKAEKLRQVMDRLPSNEKILLSFDQGDQLNGTQKSVEKILTYAQPEILFNKVEIVYL